MKKIVSLLMVCILFFTFIVSASAAKTESNIAKYIDSILSMGTSDIQKRFDNIGYEETDDSIVLADIFPISSDPEEDYKKELDMLESISSEYDLYGLYYTSIILGYHSTYNCVYEEIVITFEDYDNKTIKQSIDDFYDVMTSRYGKPTKYESKGGFLSGVQMSASSNSYTWETEPDLSGKPDERIYLKVDSECFMGLPKKVRIEYYRYL